MAIELRITGGARAGARERFDKSVVSIGRHPLSDLRFDANKDLDVSTRHAEIRSVDERHVLHDLGSTNGTFVNGARIAGERALAEGDTLRFGADGPTVTFHVAEVITAPRPRTPRRGAEPVPASGSERAASAAAPRRPTEVRIAEAVERHTGRLRRTVIALGAVVVVGLGFAFWIAQRAAAESRAQVARLLATNDSIARALDQRLRETGLADSALQAARAESERLARELRTVHARGEDLSSATAAIRSAQARTATLARMDYAAVTATNRAAIVFIAVEMPDGTPISGTGFNVLPTGLIVTNRHVVQAASGARAARIAVVFDGMEGAWQSAEIETVSTRDELALLRLRQRGTWPVVGGVARDTRGVALGDPVALLGYPLGTGTAGMGGNIDRLRPVATLGLGTVSKLIDDTMQLDAFAAPGSSGSPVFDARGLVVGVIYGGATESDGRIVYAVPAARLATLLPTDASGILR